MTRIRRGLTGGGLRGLGLGLALILAGCGTLKSVGDDIGSGVSSVGSTIGDLLPAGPAPAPVTRNLPSEYIGYVAGDEPQAVEIARRILRDGGSAADAAAAAGLAMAVTLPSRVGIAGGGVCLVHPEDKVRVDELSFAPAATPIGARGVAPIPALVRGVAALQARYGVRRWQQILAPVEALADRGVAITPRLANDFAAAGLKGPAADTVVPQHSLAQLFEKLRLGGATDLYTGDLARGLVTEGFDGQALAAYAPVWRDSVVLKGASDVLGFVPQGASRAPYGWASAWAAPGPSARIDAARAAAPPIAHPASAGVFVVDVTGQTVACEFSLGALFGTQKPLEALAGTPVAVAIDPADLAPVIVLDPGKNRVRVVATGSGPTAVADAMAATALVTRDLRTANEVLISLDQINLLACPYYGLPDSGQSCAVGADIAHGSFATLVDRLKQ